MYLHATRETSPACKHGHHTKSFTSSMRIMAVTRQTDRLRRCSHLLTQIRVKSLQRYSYAACLALSCCMPRALTLHASRSHTASLAWLSQSFVPLIIMLLLLLSISQSFAALMLLLPLLQCIASSHALCYCVSPNGEENAARCFSIQTRASNISSSAYF